MKVVTRSVVIGTTKHLFVGAVNDKSASDKFVSDLLAGLKPNGDMAVVDDGTRVWVEDVAIYDTSKGDSDAYTWDKTGNKVKCERRRVTKSADGTKTSVVERTVWRKFEEV